MRLTLRDWISLLGFASLGFSLLSFTTSSLASTPAAHGDAPTRTIDSGGMGGGMKPPASLKLNLDGRDIVTIYETGKVELAEINPQAEEAGSRHRRCRRRPASRRDPCTCLRGATLWDRSRP